MNFLNRNKKFYQGLLIVAFWGGISLLISSLTLLLEYLEGGVSSFPFSIIAFELICITPWAVCTPLIIWTARRFPFTREDLFKSIIVHIFVAGAVFSLHMIVQSWTVSIFYDIPLTANYLWRDFRGFLDMRILFYAGVLFGIYAIDYQRKIREAELRRPKIEHQLNQAKYAALLNQVQPGFLLNCIDSIEKKIAADGKQAEDFIADFSELLRIMLKNTDGSEVSVQEDIRSFELYADILGYRYGKSWAKQTHVAEPDDRELLLPSVINLLPVMEKVFAEVTVVKNEGLIFKYDITQESGTLIRTTEIEGITFTAQELDEWKKETRFPEIALRPGKNGVKKGELTIEPAKEGLIIRLEIPVKKETDQGVLV